jgi:alpha-L-fucosidase
LIGNNHHLTPFPGEDFQMFERDLPGENKSGLSFQKASDQLPLETCETMNNSWGFNITDTTYKST